MSSSDTEQQLRIWKDLAISKQMLMNEAASALKLREDCSADELRSTLEATVKKNREADERISEANAAAEEKIEEMRRSVRNIEKARNEALAERDKAIEEKEGSGRQLENGRKDNAEALKKAKRQVEDKQRELKAINTALADTPDNILKKLKTLKKQKLDESNAKKLAEDNNRKLKKDNKEKTEELDSLKGLSENSAKLVEAYRELQRWTKDNAGSTDGMPEIDESILSEIDTITASDSEVEETREAATA